MATTTTDEPTTDETKPAEPEQPDEAIARAADHAALELAVAELPNVPGQQEFLTLCQLARVMAQSAVVPRALRDKPADVLVVLMTGRDLGIPVTAALRKVYVIDGQPSIAPQLKLSLIRKKGLGRVVPHPHNDRLVDRQGAIPLGPAGRVEWNQDTDEVTVYGALGETYWYTWDDAIRAGLVRKGCTPDQHSDECDKATAAGRDRNRNVRQTNDIGVANFCKDNWRKNPRRLLWQRASGFCADDYFSEATLGLYDPDELGAILDDDGQLIDANHVELPAGFGQANGARSGGGSAESGGDEAMADPDVVWALQLRVHALPEDAQAEYKKRWMQAKIPGRLTEFPAAKEKLVESLLRGVEHQWKAQGLYDPEAGPAEFKANVLTAAVAAVASMPPGTAPRDRTPDATDEAPQDAASAPETPAATDTAPEPPSAARGDEAPNGGVPGALPLDVPEPEAAGEAEPLLSIPDEVRTASDDDKAEWAVTYVKAMRIAEIDELLRRRYQRETKGSPNDRRARLVFQILEHELDIEGAVAAE